MAIFTIVALLSEVSKKHESILKYNLPNIDQQFRCSQASFQTKMKNKYMKTLGSNFSKKCFGTLKKYKHTAGDGDAS